ncbi:hypothetical protein [Aeoliella sp.]|uniref:hypothetical protein n=1 Tax=Aeoliella sp. TaxID=2795800 RepID=UPI003CCB8F44
MDEPQPELIEPHAKPLVPGEVLQRVAAMRPSGAEQLLLQHFPKPLVRKLLDGWEGLLPPRGALRDALVVAAMEERHVAADRVAQDAKNRQERERLARRRREREGT